MNEAKNRIHRLFVDGVLGDRVLIDCSPNQAHYLGNVLRLRIGAKVLVFNGRDGEWRAEIREQSKKTCLLECIEAMREQSRNLDLHYLFAPIKRARLDYMVQKATEMGASKLLPVRTEFTQVSRVNKVRMLANAIEAAEQCGTLNVPEVGDLQDLEQALRKWDPVRRLVFCDEGAEEADPLQALQEIRGAQTAVLIGPEGGFSAAERKLLRAQPFVVPISLGPRIMRADTAAVAALALVNGVKASPG